jgi:ribosomal protein S18 acetylase RimI-like enzyme
MPTQPRRERGGARRRIREIRSASDSDFAAAYALLKRTFPRSELMPKQSWLTVMREQERGLFTDTRWHLIVAVRGKVVVGAASGSYLGNVNVGLIGYVAVDPAARERGLGPRLRRRLTDAFERDARRIRRRPLKAIVGEVDEDNPWLRTVMRRHDAIPLDIPYQQPALGPRRKRVPLVLYWEPRGHGGRRWLSASELRRLLYTIWRRAYRVRAPLREPAFRRMMAALRSRKRIGARTEAH